MICVKTGKIHAMIEKKIQGRRGGGYVAIVNFFYMADLKY